MDPFRAMRAEMDRMFERFGLPSFRRAGELDVGFRPSGGPLAGMPAVDVTEDEQAFHISAELPGLSEQDVEIGLQDDVLTLRGQKSQENERKDANYHVSERSYGSFQRGFALPPNVDREKISAAFNKGVLTITLPKTQPTPPQQKKIEIKGS
jgi:HSP20 family protein